MKRIAFILLLSLSFASHAATYYFSETDGNDSRTSTQAQSSSTPWKTLSKLTSYFSSLSNGDQILFKRGDTFYGTITVAHSSITFGAYGSGANPIITGLQDVAAWTSLGGSQYQSTSAASTLSTCNMMLINGVFQPLGQFPNTGYNTVTSSSGGTSLTSSTLSGFDFTGGTVAIRKNHWIIDKSTITAHSGTTLTFTSPSGYNITNGFGFIVLNHQAVCDMQNEWWFDGSSKKVGIYSTSSPTNIKIATVETLVTIGSTYNNLTFSDIDFIGANSYLVAVTSSGNNIDFEDCTFKYAGIDGISTQAACHHITINNCIAERFNSDFINSRSADYWTVTNNNIRLTGQVAGMGGSSNGTYTALDNIGDNSLIQYNIIKKSGYVGIDFRGSNITIANNLVDTFCNVKDDGAGIYTWTGASTTTYGRRYITNNIVLNGGGASAGTNTSNSDAFGIYMDDNSSQVTAIGNTVANCGSAGFYFHAPHDLEFRDNTVYNNANPAYAQVLCTYPGATDTDPVRNIIFKKNIIVSRTSTQVVGYFNTNESNMSQWGTWDSNYYCRPINDASSTSTFNVKGSNTNLAGWQSSSSMESHSLKSPKSISSVDSLRFEYNATDASVPVSLGATYIDMRNTTYAGSITLAPYSSAVLIYKSAGGANTPPTVDAGSNQSITLPTNSVTLSGSASDADGTITSTTWSKISGGSATITNSSSLTTTVTGLTAGTYVFQISATDNSGDTSTDQVTVIVNTAPVTDKKGFTFSPGQLKFQ